MIKLPFVAGRAPVHHMKLIGADPRHKALLARNEQRLAALKNGNRLTEDKSNGQPPATRNSSGIFDCSSYAAEWWKTYGIGKTISS